MRFRFAWDPAKEASNVRKHGVSFRRGASVFRDPNQLSLYDEQHSETEDRWVTMGINGEGVLRVVIHTFEQIDKDSIEIRIISARKATTRETEQYRKRET